MSKYIRKTPLPGTKMRIVNPIFVTRVGYPKSYEDFLPEARNILAANKLITSGYVTRGNSLEPDEGELWFPPREQRLITSLAHVLVDKVKHGGNERTLHTINRPELAGKEVEVIATKRAVTGVRYAAAYYSDGDWEPGGLNSARHHCLVAVAIKGNFTSLFARESIFKRRRWSRGDNNLVIELTNLERAE
jgi:hypothetical protein